MFSSCQPTHYYVFSSWQTHTSCQPTHYPVRLCSVADKHTSCQPTHYTVFSSWQTTPAVSPHTTLCSVAVHRQDRNQTCTVQIHTDKTETRPIPGRSTQTRQETGHVPCTSTHARQKTGSWMTYRSTQAGQKTDLQIHTGWTENWPTDPQAGQKTDLQIHRLDRKLTYRSTQAGQKTDLQIHTGWTENWPADPHRLDRKLTYRSTQAGQKTDLQIFTKTAQSVNLQNSTDTETQQKDWCVDRHKTDL